MRSNKIETEYVVTICSINILRKYIKQPKYWYAGKVYHKTHAYTNISNMYTLHVKYVK